MNIKIPIAFITPCFCRGADCSDNGAPEIRPASIRGQLHWWFRALDGSPDDEKNIFGSVRNGAKASPLVVRVKYDSIAEKKSPTLPHKPERPASKQAIADGVSFELRISTRLGGLSPDLEKKFFRALNAWLHLGALGLRATRGGGNFTWDTPKTSDGSASGVMPPPQTPEVYDEAIKKIIGGTKLCAVLLNKPYPDAEAARKIITDTISHQGLSQENFPLGAVKQGKNDHSGAPGRKTSPLRFRIVKFAEDSFRIAAAWDGRQNVTGNAKEDLQAVIRKLKEAGKNIGIQLAASPLAG